MTLLFYTADGSKNLGTVFNFSLELPVVFAKPLDKGYQYFVRQAVDRSTRRAIYYEIPKPKVIRF